VKKQISKDYFRRNGGLANPNQFRRMRSGRWTYWLLLGCAALTGCAAMPDRARIELSHDSHATTGSAHCSQQCSEDGLSRASLILKWQRGPVTIEAGEGWNLRGRNGGGFYGPGEVFTGRIGYEFNLKGPRP